MPEMKVRIRDIQTGKIRVRTYRGELRALERLKAEIMLDRGSYKPPGTAIHTPVPPGVRPRALVPSFLVEDPIVIVGE